MSNTSIETSQSQEQLRENTDNIKTQMRKGILEYCILLLLRDQELYANEIIEALKEADLIVVEGALYPLISRMRKWNMIRSRNVSLPIGAPRKYFSLTPEGHLFLDQLEQNWEAIEYSVNTLKRRASEYAPSSVTEQVLDSSTETINPEIEQQQ